MIIPLQTTVDDENLGWPVANRCLIALASTLALATIFAGAFPGGFWQLAAGLLCLIGWGNALAHRLGPKAYLGFCVLPIGVSLCFGATVPMAAMATGLAIAGATTVLIPFGSMALGVWILPLFASGVVGLFGSNFGSAVFIAFSSILYWIYVGRSWDFHSPLQLLGRLMFFAKVHLPILASGVGLVALVLWHTDATYLPCVALGFGALAALIVNGCGLIHAGPSPTLVEWALRPGSSDRSERPRTPAPTRTTTSGRVVPRLTITAGFVD